MKYRFKPPEQPSLLRNPLAIGSLAVVTTLAVLGSMFFTGFDAPKSSALQKEGINGWVTSTVKARAAPGEEYPPIMTVFGGTLVRVIGRTSDSKWLQIMHPPGSGMKGWIQAGFVDLRGDINAVPIASWVEPQPESTNTPEASATPKAAADLVIVESRFDGTRLFVTVANRGKASFPGGDVALGIQDERTGGTLLVSKVRLPSMQPNAVREVDTRFVCGSAPLRIAVVVDFESKIEESDDTNNRIVLEAPVCSPPTPKPTSTAPAPPPTAVPTAPEPSQTPRPTSTPAPPRRPTSTPVPPPPPTAPPPSATPKPPPSPTAAAPPVTPTPRRR